VEVARRPFKGFGKIDFFGLWDIIAYRVRPWTETELGIRPALDVLDPEGCPELLLVQVRSNEKGNIQAQKDFKVPRAGVGSVKKQIVVYKDYSRGPWIEDI